MATITVNNVAALNSALQSAHSGDTVQLNPGVYSDLSIRNLSFAQGVTITSADPNNPAVLTNFLMNNVKGLTLTNLELVAKAGVPGFGNWGFQIYGSDNLKFDHLNVHGSLDGNSANDTGALLFQKSTNITVTNSEFTQLRAAIAQVDAAGGSNLTITDNHIHHVMKAGVMISGVSNVNISHNTITDITPVNGEHADAIQFFTTGTTESARNIVVADNVILRGDGGPTQGIFLSDQTGKLPFINVTIKDNLVVGTGPGGIFVVGATDVKISGNGLTSFEGATGRTNLRVENSTHVVTTDNTALSIFHDSNVFNLTQSGNTLNQVATDAGQAALRNWQLEHPADKAMVAPYISAAIHSSPTAPATLALTASAPSSSVVTLETGRIELTLTKGTQTEAIGNASNNVITGIYNDSKLSGLAGNDTLNGGGGRDTLDGGDGDDTYIINNDGVIVIELAGKGVDTVVTTKNYVLGDNVENLVLSGGATTGVGNGLDNVITGNAANNRLEGGAGADTLSGGAGADVLVGGAGADRLIGGAGADIFSFKPGDGKDVIVDFSAGDQIDARAYLQAGLKATIVDTGPDVAIKFSNGDSITLLGVDPSALHATSSGWMF